MLQRKGSGSGSGGGALAAACLLLSGRLGSYSPMSRARRVMLWGGRARSVTCMAGGRLSAPHFFFFRSDFGKRGLQSAGNGIGRGRLGFAENLGLLRLLVNLLRKFSCMHSLARLSLLLREAAVVCAAVAQVAVARLIGGIGYKQRLARKIIDAMSAKSEWRLVPFQPHRKTVANENEKCGSRNKL